MQVNIFNVQAHTHWGNLEISTNLNCKEIDIDMDR